MKKLDLHRTIDPEDPMAHSAVQAFYTILLGMLAQAAPQLAQQEITKLLFLPDSAETDILNLGLSTIRQTVKEEWLKDIEGAVATIAAEFNLQTE